MLVAHDSRNTLLSLTYTVKLDNMAELNLTVKVHPVVLFQIVDAFERRNADSQRVIGTLLGECRRLSFPRKSQKCVNSRVAIHFAAMATLESTHTIILNANISMRTISIKSASISSDRASLPL